jgi:hypothetical protein
MSNGWRPASAGVVVGLGIAFLAGLAAALVGVAFGPGREAPSRAESPSSLPGGARVPLVTDYLGEDNLDRVDDAWVRAYSFHPDPGSADRSLALSAADGDFTPVLLAFPGDGGDPVGLHPEIQGTRVVVDLPAEIQGSWTVLVSSGDPSHRGRFSLEARGGVLSSAPAEALHTLGPWEDALWEARMSAGVPLEMEAPPGVESPPPAVQPPDPLPGPPVTTLFMPSFPWPPPQASAVAQLTQETMDVTPPPRTLGEVDARLRVGLEGAGYVERSYYSVPGGFAMVTRLEQIEADGRPKAGSDRWAPDPGPLRPFTLRGYLRALLGANPGYFRILVLVVTPERFYQDETTVTREEAQRWLTSGFNDLPAELARLPADDQIRVTGLIYEFLVPTVGEAADIAIPGRLTGPTHIQRSGILDHLRR